MSDKGLLTKVIEEKLSVALDDLVKVGGLWEHIDGLAFRTFISLMDDTLGEKVPEPYKSEIKELLVMIFEEEDYQEAVAQAFRFADECIDIPGIDDEMENLLFSGLASIVVAAILQIKKNEV